MRNTREIISAVFFGAVVAVLIYAASQTVAYHPFLRIQNAIDDSHFMSRSILQGLKEHKTEQVVIIDIDDSSIHALGKFKLWPRRLFGEVIGNLSQDGARLIFLDVFLKDGGSYSDNRVLADSIRSAGNVLSGYYFKLDAPSKKQRPLDPVFNQRLSSSVLYPESFAGDHFIRARQIVLPYSGLVMSVKGMGFTNYIPDPDSIIRHIPLYISHGRTLYPSAALKIWLYLEGFQNARVNISPESVSFVNTYIPTDKHCFMRLNFTGSQSAFKTISFVDVLNGDFEPGTFREKVVMIGSSSEKLPDLKQTPGHSSLPGVEIHATALITLLNRRFLSVTSGNIIFAITVLSGILSSVLFSFASPVRVGLPVVIGVPLGLYIYTVFSFIVFSQLVNISLPSFVIFLLFIVMTIYRIVEKYETGYSEKKGIDK